MSRLYHPAVYELIQRVKYFCPWLSYEKRFRFREVEYKKLYRSAQPTPEAFECFLRKYNIRSVITLLKVCPKWELDFVEVRDLKLLRFPIYGRAPNNVEVNEFLDFASDSTNQPVLAHCAQGRDRTGLFCFLYRVEKMGWHPDIAWSEMKDFGHRSFPWHRWTQRHIKIWLEKKYRIQLK